MTQSSVRYLGSRELHRELPRILDELTDRETRLVLTIHSRPKAVLIGAEAFANLVRQVAETDRRLGEELATLLESPRGKPNTKPKRTVVARSQKKTSATARSSPQQRQNLTVNQT